MTKQNNCAVSLGHIRTIHRFHLEDSNQSSFDPRQFFALKVKHDFFSGNFRAGSLRILKSAIGVIGIQYEKCFHCTEQTRLNKETRISVPRISKRVFTFARHRGNIFVGTNLILLAVSYYGRHCR